MSLHRLVTPYWCVICQEYDGADVDFFTLESDAMDYANKVLSNDGNLVMVRVALVHWES